MWAMPALPCSTDLADVAGLAPYRAEIDDLPCRPTMTPPTCWQAKKVPLRCVVGVLRLAAADKLAKPKPAR
jgi:hypothetical protein